MPQNHTSPQIKKNYKLMQTTLTPMQKFFLDAINNSGKECNPCYLAVLYYESIGKRRHAASRDSFGQTSAAYRTCRKLASLNLVKEIRYKTGTRYAALNT